MHRDRTTEPSLLRPRNAALCLLVLVWGSLLLNAAIEQNREVHLDGEWFIGWVVFCLLAGLPVSPVSILLLRQLPDLPEPLGMFLFWLTNASLSSAFWLVVLPAVHRSMQPETAKRG